MAETSYKKFTEEEFFELCEKLEEVSNVKLEYFEGLIFPVFSNEPIATLDIDTLLTIFQQIDMPTFNHSTIASNLSGELYIFTKSNPFYKVLDSGLMVQIVRQKYVHPDVTVIEKGKQIFNERNHLINPLIVVEVVSPSTGKKDKTYKLDDYKQIASLEEYLIVEQTKPYVTQFIRTVAGWKIKIYQNIEETIIFSAIPFALQMKDIYAEVRFD